MRPTRARLADGRWHFQHGPIDLVIGADGDRADVAGAHDAAWGRFTTVLDELVAELPALRRPVDERCAMRGAIARRMWHACAPHRTGFITSMAAVAGAVADTLIGCYRRDGIERAWVNNGGDIAVHLADDATVRVGLVVDLSRHRWEPRGSMAVDGRFVLHGAMNVRGLATSGWRGRSFSLGIADSVTVLARTAADADAAATVIANAVDVDDERIGRRPASSLKDDSDLGDRRVTIDVPALDAPTITRALRAGHERATTLQGEGRIAACFLTCQGRSLTVGFASLRSRIEHLEAA